jgi:polyisoprenoid-binding protein YceI
MKALYKIDPAHFSAHFIARHMMTSNVRGGLGKVEGTVGYDPENLAASTVDVITDASTVSTMKPARNMHLKSPA